MNAVLDTQQIRAGNRSPFVGINAPGRNVVRTYVCSRSGFAKGESYQCFLHGMGQSKRWNVHDNDTSLLEFFLISILHAKVFPTPPISAFTYDGCTCSREC